MTQTRRKAGAKSLALAVGIWAAAPLWAHHGTNISYDRTKQWTQEGVVTQFVYGNPHPQLYVDLKNDKGEVANWTLELLPNVAQLIRNGWSRQRANEVLAPGKKVNLIIAPARAGGTTGLAIKIMTEKGEEVVTAPVPTGGPGTAPAP